MYGYKCFYNGREHEVHANSSYEAQQKAEKFFNPPKSKKHLVSVHLCEKPTGQVVHTPSF